MIPTRLFHYCCRHSAQAIGDLLRPGPDGLLWLTDLATPNRQALGLTSHTLRCDRVEYRFEVKSTRGVVSWLDFARLSRLSLDVRLGLDGTPGAQPRRWFVCLRPLLVLDVQTMATAVIP